MSDRILCQVQVDDESASRRRQEEKSGLETVQVRG